MLRIVLLVLLQHDTELRNVFQTAFRSRPPSAAPAPHLQPCGPACETEYLSAANDNRARSGADAMHGQCQASRKPSPRRTAKTDTARLQGWLRTAHTHISSRHRPADRRSASPRAARCQNICSPNAQNQKSTAAPHGILPPQFSAQPFHTMMLYGADSHCPNLFPAQHHPDNA